MERYTVDSYIQHLAEIRHKKNTSREIIGEKELRRMKRINHEPVSMNIREMVYLNQIM